ncbi:CD276 antigen homolog [Micropterus salmoides]|uniref:CD276 antigen homolog n=1 Tax=Micropterus salmoides TaxID=27706 RepID=UPI0018ED2436|nr:CD276 antigen homolog [Micropterus salmoides]
MFVSTEEIIQAVIGDDVILPCHTVFDKNNSKVTWKHRDQIVHTYQYGKDCLTNQDTNFKNRTSLFHDEMTRGNLSLKLTNVTERDAGNYSCEVPEHPEHNITLVVERKPTKGPVHVTILYIGLSLGGLFIGALIGIVWKKYGNTSRCAGRDRRERNRAGIRESFPMRINMENPNDAAS